MEITEYIYPELLFIVPFLNVTGWWLKHKTEVSNRFIPPLLGLFAVVLSVAYIYSSMEMSFLESLAGGLVQGLLLASAAVYANQLTKAGKGDENDNNH